MKKNKINLSDIPKLDIDFAVSTEYFEALPSKIQEKIQEKTKKNWWKNNHFRYASVAAVLILGLFYFQNQKNLPETDISLSDEDVAAYLLKQDVFEDEIWDSYAKTEDLQNEELLIDELIIEELAEDLEDMGI